MNDTAAMNRIQEILNEDIEWSPDTLEDIARVVREKRTVLDVGEEGKKPLISPDAQVVIRIQDGDVQSVTSPCPGLLDVDVLLISDNQESHPAYQELEIKDDEDYYETVYARRSQIEQDHIDGRSLDATWESVGNDQGPTP